MKQIGVSKEAATFAKLLQIDDHPKGNGERAMFSEAHALTLFPIIQDLLSLGEEEQEKDNFGLRVQYLTRAYHMAQVLCSIHNVTEETLTELDDRFSAYTETLANDLQDDQTTKDTLMQDILSNLPTAHSHAPQVGKARDLFELERSLLLGSIKDYSDWLGYYDSTADKDTSPLIGEKNDMMIEEEYYLVTAIVEMFQTSQFLLAEMGVSPRKAVKLLHKQYEAAFVGDAETASKPIKWKDALRK